MTIQKIMSGKILLVEDDAMIAQMYKDKFAVAGYDVVGADSGATTFNLLKTFKPDIILLDIMLPGGMNGFDILTIIKKNQDLKDIPVIMLTNLESEKKTAVEMGAKDYFIKSETPLEELLAKIKKYTKHGLL